MRRFLAIVAILSAALLASSCGKENISPEDLIKDSSKVAKITAISKTIEEIPNEAALRDFAVYRKSDKEGESWFLAWGEGKMYYDCVSLSIYFDSVDEMKVGKPLSISRFWFSFVASSDSRASTETFNGKITLASKGQDYVILHFNKVRCSCSMGVFLIAGYLQCPLREEYN